VAFSFSLSSFSIHVGFNAEPLDKCRSFVDDRIFQSPVTCLFDCGYSCGWDEDIASGFAEGGRWGHWFGRVPDSVLGDFCDAGSVGVLLTFGGKITA
jgi:hypothetical protein